MRKGFSVLFRSHVGPFYMRGNVWKLEIQQSENFHPINAFYPRERFLKKKNNVKRDRNRHSQMPKCEKGNCLWDKKYEYKILFGEPWRT